MHLHRLTITNVGPFAGEVSIDFARMGTSGLFLLEGPTGAGKSTVLDAIVFALYGQVATAEASVRRMRSELADPSDEPIVELVFETPSGIFRVRRSPAYDRPKRVGAGSTTCNATVTLWRLATPEIETGELLSNRHEEANLEISRIVGLKHDQFVQTVVLPQGQFATFLRAKPEDRRELLQKLFGTGLYEKIAQEIDSARRLATIAREESTQVVEHAITALATAAELDDEVADNLRSVVDAEHLAAETSELLSGLGAAVEEANQQTFAAEIARLAAREAASDASHVAALLQRRDQLKSRRECLVAEFDTYQLRVAELESLRDIAKVEPVLRSLSTARHKVVATKQQSDRLAAAVAARHGESPDFGSGAKLARTLRTGADSLVYLVEQESELAAHASRLRILDELIDEQLTAVAALEISTNAIPAKLKSRTIERDELLTQTAGRASLTTEFDRAQQQLAAAQSLSGVDDELLVASTAVSEAHAVAEGQVAALARLHSLRIDGIAGELAGRLSEGQSCPVCGSTQHPKLAVFTDQHPSAHSIELAQTQVQRGEKLLRAARHGYDALTVQAATLAAKANGMSVADAQDFVERLQIALDQTARRAERLNLVDEEIESLRDRISKEQSELLRLRVEIGEATTEQFTLAQALHQLTERIHGGRAGFETVAQRIADLRSQADEIDSYVLAAEATRSAELVVLDLERELADLLTKFDLESEVSVRALLPNIANIDWLQSTVARYQQEDAILTDGLAAAEFEQLDNVLVPLVSELTVAAQAAELAHTEAATRGAKLANRLGAATNKADRVAACALARDQIVADTQATFRIADVVNARSPDNLLRIGLPSYVLMARFQDVVRAANARLRTMSEGRYELEHTTEKEKNGRRSGLGLQIRDLRTKALRAPGDLSGGETFYTSLALALGLADVVTSEAGGIELGTLFIDEGFGSLDSETLDSVLAEISKLRRGGRVVGVVSHVDELKQRISDRIQVRQDASGRSTISLVS